MPPENERRPGEPGASGSDRPSEASRQGNDSTSFSIAQQFLDALYDPLDRFIEIRLIEERRRGRLVERVFYGRPHEVIADLDRLLAIAEKRRAAVFFGVLRRVEKGRGTAADVIAGRVLWADLDFKDYNGGEEMARQRLAMLPTAPSILVHTGHGVHAYWLLRENLPPEEIVALTKRLAEFLGADHAFDAARLLRLPGTLNRKAQWAEPPGDPIQVRIEFLEAERRYNPSEIADALDMVEAGDVGADEGAESDVREGLSERVQDLLESNSKLRALFEGRSKPSIGPDGKLDTTSSGYDFSLACALYKKGIRDPAEIAAAIDSRPDRAAHVRGPRYIQRTVGEAIRRMQNPKRPPTAESAEPDFVVERVRIFVSTPASYELTIEGVQITLSSAELRAPGKFSTCFCDALFRIPVVPRGGAWAELVNSWLRRGERVELPPEASDEPALREAVQRAVDNLAVTDEVEDLDRGKAVPLADGRRAFKAEPLLRVLREDRAGLSLNHLCRVLNELGYRSKSRRLGDISFRAWALEVPPSYAREKTS